MSDKTTHFGFTEVREAEKAARVEEVFSSVAGNYDRMNDLMSLGMHRLWKRFAISMADVRPGSRVLDVASGSGDLALAFAKRAGPEGLVVMTDINGAMLQVGRDKVLDHGRMAPPAICNGERLPFPDDTFDCVTIAFGLRNFTDKARGLAEMTRVARPGGRVLVLEFSKVWKPLAKPYDTYSFTVLPWLGKRVAKDEAAYQYLAESIRMHPDQETLKAMMAAAGLVRAEYFNLTLGVVALHRGFKP
ncbi:MAG: bifunctional demethylmenaquinone methyltransferase/2-methoxy-6-polyprenyl-1,4-benzoquinol methylase UbiE [Betaproteobacteria bacterium]|nr:bifunctional demethylmenaquinone methyltransferase/2-methoxy-6-polyprenyl-1,4-benzoquinol methylase UbiE [Betaproteobacteria bacterium]